MNNGQLVPDEKITICMMHETAKIHGPFLLDGFPRTYSQAKSLFEVTNIDCVLNLIVPYDIIIKRVENRFIHPGSGRVYNLDFNPPKISGKDDLTGEKLVIAN
jgi:adenylate kinase family enzyme